MHEAVLPDNTGQKCVDAKLRPLLLGFHEVPVIIVENHDAAGRDQRPDQGRIGVNIGRKVTTIDIDNVELPGLDGKPRYDGS